jgi:hypothetical protein
MIELLLLSGTPFLNRIRIHQGILNSVLVAAREECISSFVAYFTLASQGHFILHRNSRPRAFLLIFFVPRFVRLGARLRQGASADPFKASASRVFGGQIKT